MRSVLSCALAYLEAGLCPIPVKSDGSKAPDIAAWKRYQSERPTEANLQEWFGATSSRGIGLIWGATCGNGEALDFDKPGLFDEFAALCLEHGYGEIVDSCVLVETPSGGRHLLYRSDQSVQSNRKLAQFIDASGQVKTLIETRGEGGYTLAPGSPAQCHPSGQPYSFLRGCPADIPTISAEQREMLLALASTFNEYVKPGSVRDASPKNQQIRNERHNSGEVRPGDDYNERGDYEAVLDTAGWRRLRDISGKTLWQRPGKTGVGISATSNYADRGLFHVFSTNAAPFEPETSYSPFAVYTLLEHAGDYEAAARELRTLGYGSAPGNAPETSGVSASQASPAPKHIPQWPTCEPEAFHGLVGEIVRAIEPHTEADSVGLLLQLLVAFGNAVGPSAHFLAEADKHRGNLFAVMVGVSSKGRKGTSWGYIRELFKLAQPTWAEQCVKSGLSSGEGLIHHVRDAVVKEKEDKKTGAVETIVEDEGVSDKRLLILETEFTAVLRQTDRDGNTLSATVRNAWDTGSLQSLTKNSPVRATGAHISIIGHITKDELKRELSATETANGFGNRFLWACVRRSKELPEGGKFRVSEQAGLIARLHATIENASETTQLDRDSGARAVWLAIYHDLSTGKPGLFGALTGRSEAQVMRLALLYALLDQAAAIRAEHLTAAIALWEYCEASVRYVFGDSLGDRVADEILQMLRQAQGGMSRNEIRDAFGRNRSSQQIGSSLALLAEVGAARSESRNLPGAGRPTEYWIATR